MSLKSVIHELENRRKTVTVFSDDELDGLLDYFGDRHVAVEYAPLPVDANEPFVVVSNDHEFLGSVSLRALTAFDSPCIYDPDERDLLNAEHRYLLTLLDDTLFSSFSRRQMLATSREIEDRAVRGGHGRLFSGFQTLAALREQVDVYRKLGTDTDLDVHVFGQPDWEPPAIEGVVVHRIRDPEITETWFVAYDGGGNAYRKCALLAEEAAPGDFTGFWTYDPLLVDRIVDCIEGDFVTPESETP